MPKQALLFGSLLIALGLIGFVATGSTHKTALIPAIPGLILALCGVIGTAVPKARMHVMHVAALIGLLGASGLAMSAKKILVLVGGGAVERPIAAWLQFGMGAISLVFLVLCVKSFIDARRARKAAGN